MLRRDTYTGGYFLNNSGVAVLAINAFANPAETEDANTIQQSVIKQFLAACKASGKTKLIVDLQGNGGGHIENGYNTYKQIFPIVDPLAPLGFALHPSLNTSAIQAVVDENLDDFASYKDFNGPEDIYGDTFTALMRFAAEDIVLLYDGACGSTCAIFSEFMKSQAGVSSIAVGGRPQTGPIAEVWTYGTVLETIVGLAETYAESKENLPLYDGPPEYNIFLAGPPLSGSLSSNCRFNLRNNYNSTPPDELPLQFVYEATNCRPFYQRVDLISIVPL